MIEQRLIEFGEIDAKHEVFSQTRMGRDIFFRSYQLPPNVDEAPLITGGKFFILGQKGCGKTALSLYLREKYRRAGHTTDIVLFKSDLTEVERQKLIQGSEISVIEAIEMARTGVDYKSNWLWYIIVHLSYMINSEDILQGHDYLEDLKALTGASVRPKQSVFSGLRLSKIRGDIAAHVNAGVFKSDLKAELEAIQQSTDQPESDIIEASERCLSRIRLKVSKRVALFFDELELFSNEDHQRKRDLYLIRDLLYAVSRINRKLGAESASVVIYASVRSEVLDEVNRVGEEITKDVDDFGVRIDWDVSAQSVSQPLISVIASKINASEIEEGELETEDVWTTYFPSNLFGKDFRQYLLDVSMFRPRNIIRRLNVAKRRGDAIGFLPEDFESSELIFSTGVWREIEDELRVAYSPAEVAAIKAFLSGFRPKFTLRMLEQRIIDAEHVPSAIRNQFKTKQAVTKLLNALYRAGAIGNLYLLETERGRLPRDRWSFRGFSEPLYDREFLVHNSIRKSLQLPFA